MDSRDRRRGTRSLGQLAESVALDWLSGQGLEPIARNVQSRHGEIDLVMLDGHVLVFVEVRCRRGRSLTSAANTVRHRKQQRLAAAALFFLARNPVFADHAVRFDVVGFDRSPDRSGPDTWIRNAFEPDLGSFGR